MKATTNYFAVLSLDDYASTSEDEAAFATTTQQTRPTPPTKSESVALRPETPPTSSCPLLEKMPTELRIEIYGLVLKTKYSLVNVGHLQPYKRGKTVSTAIFRTCRVVFAEAEEVFYEINTMRVKSLNDPYQDRPLTRHLEITGDLVRRMTLWPGTICSNAGTAGFTGLKKLKALTMSIDHYGEGLPTRTSRPASKDKARKPVIPGNDFRVVDYGHIEVEKDYKSDVRVFIKRFRMMKAVEAARSLERSTSLIDLFTRVARGVGRMKEKAEEVAQDLFLLRLACIEAWRTTRDGPSLHDLEQGIVDRYILEVTPADEKDMLDRLLKMIPSDTRVVDLTSEEHGDDVMRLADGVVSPLLVPPYSLRRG